jgi:hypothetical protein
LMRGIWRGWMGWMRGWLLVSFFPEDGLALLDG